MGINYREEAREKLTDYGANPEVAQLLSQTVPRGVFDWVGEPR